MNRYKKGMRSALMLFWLSITIVVIVLVMIPAFKRWMPVLRVPCSSLPQIQETGVHILDVREYQESDRNPVRGAFALPYPYLKRHLQTVPKKEVFLVAPDKVSRNLSTRLLLKNGFTVTGYAVVRRGEQGYPPVKLPCSGS